MTGDKLKDRCGGGAVRLRPWRMAATVPALLASAQRWEVVQRFKRGVLLSGSDNDKTLLFVGTDETSSGPFHLQLSAPQFAQLPVTEVQTFSSEDGLLVADDVIIETEAVPRYEVEAPTLSPNAASFALRELTAYLAGSVQVTGLGLAPLDLLAPDGPLPCALDELAQELAYGRTCELGQPGRTNQPLQQPSRMLASYLMGRGQGLTPSGDDFLVGMMAVINVSALQAAVAARVACAAVTGVVSQAYFTAAFRRCFDEDICQMLGAANRGNTALFARVCARIAQHGHSSGIDLLTGALYALRVQNVISRVGQE